MLINQNKSVSKGTQILVEGRLKLSSWVDTMGQKRQRHLIAGERAIVFDDPKPQQDAVSGRLRCR
jgi:single-stranded DNA-binding protein